MNSQVFVILINIMQLQHMRMLNQFQNGNLSLNLVKQRRDSSKGTKAEHTGQTVGYMKHQKWGKWTKRGDKHREYGTVCLQLNTSACVQI